MNRILLFFAVLWELPQCLFGVLYLLLHVMLGRQFSFKDGIFDGDVLNSVCLGELVFVNVNSDAERRRKHECGHRIQSRILGPFYLFAVGIPSLVLWIRAKSGKMSHEEYHSHYPENWADKLGGVEHA